MSGRSCLSKHRLRDRVLFPTDGRRRNLASSCRTLAYSYPTLTQSDNGVHSVVTLRSFRMPHPNATALRGLLTAILTPLDLQGRLALEHYPALLSFQRRAGVDGVVVCGTNGEGTSLSVEERKQALEAALAHRDRLTVVAGTGAANLPDALEL